VPKPGKPDYTFWVPKSGKPDYTFWVPKSGKPDFGAPCPRDLPNVGTLCPPH
jgi:hypothetical protein